MGDEELLWTAVSEAVAPVAHLETQYEREQLEKRIRDYFKKGVKGLDFAGKPWDLLIHEYADRVYSSLFCGLGDRSWLSLADFLLCADAAVKDLFPPHLFVNVPQQVFESTVLAASDRAFDEQRFWSFSWKPIQRTIIGKGTQKKIREALGTSRPRVIKEDIEQIEYFVNVWVRQFVEILAATTQGDPASCLNLETAVELFQGFVQEGGLPLKMTIGTSVPPPGWPVVKNFMTQAFAQYGYAPCGGGSSVFNRGRKGGNPLVPPAPVRPTSSTPSSSWIMDSAGEPYGGDAGGDHEHMGSGQNWSHGSWEGGNDSAEAPAKRWKGG